MFTFKGRSIEKIAVVGSGQIGPDIALYFAKVFTPHGVPVVVVVNRFPTDTDAEVAMVVEAAKKLDGAIRPPARAMRRRSI